MSEKPQFLSTKEIWDSCEDIRDNPTTIDGFATWSAMFVKVDAGFRITFANKDDEATTLEGPLRKRAYIRDGGWYRIEKISNGA